MKYLWRISGEIKRDRYGNEEIKKINATKEEKT